MKEISIPKILNFDNWESTAFLDDFSFPWENEKAPRTIFNAYYNETNLHFRFIAFCSNKLVYVENNQKLEVIHSERVEIFFRVNEKMNPYYCLEIDPYGRVLDYQAKFYRDFDRTWQWPNNLNVKTQICDDFYVVEGEISLEILKSLNLLKDNKLELGLYRGHCVELKNQNQESNLKWISWVHPKSPKPDFHIESSFGILNLQ